MESATVPVEEFSNDLVRFKVVRKPHCRVEFEVTALKPLVMQARSKAVKAIAKQVTLPGFRKGKAPDALIVKNYASQVDRQSEEEVAKEAFQACQSLANIPTLNRENKISFNVKKSSLEEAEVVVGFETEPMMPSVDPSKFHLTPVERPVVNEEKIQETIRQVLFFFASWEKIQDRPIAEGDFVRLDVDVIEENPPKTLFADTRFEVVDRSMAKWMKELVLGKNAGDVVEGVSVPDEDLSADQKEAFKPQKVRITVLCIEKAILPEITPEFLSGLGVSSEEELKANIEKLLIRQADRHVQEKEREQVNEFLLQEHPFDLPMTLIDRELRFRFEQIEANEMFRNYWETLAQEEKKKIFTSLYAQSEKAVKMFYICRKVLQDAHIEVSPLDLPAPSMTTLEVLLDPQESLDYHMQPEVRHAEALSRLILEKAADYVIANRAKS